MKKILLLSFTLSLMACKDVKQNQETTQEEAIVSEVSAEKAKFSKKLDWKNTSFEVSFSQDTLKVLPSGLEIVNDLLIYPVEGVSVANAMIADLNADGHAEILVHLVSDGSGSYGELVAYSVNNGKSTSVVYYNPELEDESLAEGYMGHDSFEVVDEVLIRSFPIYKDGDSNASPTGGTRTIEYNLIDGEANRQLVVKK